MEARRLRELCHDVTVPAAAIRLLADRVAAESPAGSPHRETLRLIATEARRIADVCASFLNEPICPNAARLDDAAAQAAASARMRYSARIEVVADEAVTVAVSPVAAGRILANLLDNACRATGPRGSVRVLVTNADAQARLTVADSGPGFGRAAAGAAGLGLRIVAELVRQAGGGLILDDSDSGGAAVTVTLPTAPEQSSGPADDPDGIGVVICDPHRAFADALAALLASSGWRVLGCARDVGKAAAISAAVDARVCVTELVPSDLGNDQLLADAVASAPRTVFTALTASDDPAALREALAAGVRGLALKSDDFGEIRQLLERCAASHDPIRSGPALMSAAARTLVRSTGPPAAEGSAAPGVELPLTPREHEALRCLVRGESTEQIAAAMGVRVATARGHLDSLLAKLGAHSRIEAVALGVRAGLVEIPAQRTATSSREAHIVPRSVQ